MHVPHSPLRSALVMVLALLPGLRAWAQDAVIPPPKLEIGAGLSRTPGWMGDDRKVTHGLVWVNAEYTTRSFGRFQLNGGSLTTDGSANWDPWVQGFASAGLMVGYHGNPGLGEGRNPRLGGPGDGLDVGVQAVLPVFGAPLFLQARRALGADQGWFLVGGFYLPVHPVKRMTLAFIPSARWLDAREARYQFAAPGSGFQDVSLEVAMDWEFTPHLRSNTALSHRWLTGPAADSPYAPSHRQLAFLAGATYTF